ncbi:50S ribosomal protein L2 [archaeon HR06]|nr:50S ribosomal protein L2 [archaeon HR06]
MGKRILVQRMGKGGSQFRAAKVGKIADARYPLIPQNITVEGVVEDILHERGRLEPLAKIKITNDVFYLPAVKGLEVGQKIILGPDAPIQNGNILPLYKIPDGTIICNIEKNYGDGGKLVRASGTSAILVSHTEKGALITLPSGKKVIINEKCRATIGQIAGGGRIEKPFLKAGNKYHAMRARGRKYPLVKGVAMAAVYHPFGGAYKKKKFKTVSRNAPPGAKVGHIAARQTGRRKAKRKLAEVVE